MHLGVIPDGNRRYASDHGIEKKEAYSRAKDTITDVFMKIDESEEVDVEIEEATFYLLSEENLRRDRQELGTLFQLLRENIFEVAKQFHGKDFRFNWVTTRPSAIPEGLRKKLKKMENKFNRGERDLNLLISYSGKRDILQASRQIHENGGDFSQESFQDHLGIKSDIDFVIRTGDNPDRECVSGFPIWNSSYAEYFHIKKNFPAVTYEDVRDALNHFSDLRRKKGN